MLGKTNELIVALNGNNLGPEVLLHDFEKLPVLTLGKMFSLWSLSCLGTLINHILTLINDSRDDGLFIVLQL